MSGIKSHLGEQLRNGLRVSVKTRFGRVTGARAANGAIAFLEVPYALPPKRFSDPDPLPPTFRYEDKEYVYETKHCAQPGNDGQSAGTPPVHRVGMGEPSEDPLYVNIVCPSDFSPESKYPVRVYIHGGFLQFGSPHGLSSQAQFVAETRKEVWVNIGYRLSIFGFLACDEPRIEGNYGFKDQWLALQWVKDNIVNFGGDVDDIRLSGLSAGAHSVHQILHHVSHLPAGQVAPFHSVQMQSNGFLTTPKSLAELRPQYHDLCTALGLSPTDPSTLEKLRDPSQISASKLTDLITSEELGMHGTFRGALDGTWLPTSVDPMAWQRSGALARALKAKGVRSISIGDLTEEWYLYAIAHPVHAPRDAYTNMLRYYPESVVRALFDAYAKRGVTPGETAASAFDYMGRVVADGQVHIPVRMFVRDFAGAGGVPVVRYEIRWTPEQVRPKGYVTHATDRPLWALRTPELSPEQEHVALAWLDAIDAAHAELEGGQGSGVLAWLRTKTRGVKDILTLKEDKTIGWTVDKKWDELMSIVPVLPGESKAKL
ncbi:carboxylesterase [Coniophora puteana RWD-64-598 SS2]|uniref:Carboxylic ester hydrolase n=1 Tax=Coniophora puteana (strain RWD-64-598) TaxID=741705 RepID=A0A5M3M7A3_CONPW|nr:carboxylesterase [Coniophora puteana RWD-64-598 SS2]EIW75118.1 carboxylesterase [Coniophora puteana RWD-64-598 SS2]